MRLQTRPRARKSGAVKITKPDGTTSIEQALSPGEMGRMASLEAKGRKKVAARIAGRRRKAGGRKPWDDEDAGDDVGCVVCESRPEHDVELTTLTVPDQEST